LSKKLVECIRWFQEEIPGFALSSYAAQLSVVITKVSPEDTPLFRSRIWKWTDFFVYLGVDTASVKLIPCLEAKSVQVKSIWNIPPDCSVKPKNISSYEVLRLMLSSQFILMPCHYTAGIVLKGGLQEHLCNMDNRFNASADLIAKWKLQFESDKNFVFAKQAEVLAERDKEVEKLKAELAGLRY